jgi:hypothetical protein
MSGMRATGAVNAVERSSEWLMRFRDMGPILDWLRECMAGQRDQQGDADPTPRSGIVREDT